MGSPTRVVSMGMRLLGVALMVRGEFVEFPVEYADEMTMEAFRVKYVEALRPVIIRGNARTRAEAKQWGVESLVDRCGAGEITRYVSDPTSEEWGGFDMRTASKVSLGSFFAETEVSEAASDIYGFDYNLKCDCEAFVREASILPYFKQDVTNQLAFTGAAWRAPGSEGASMPLHLSVHESAIPFGRVDFEKRCAVVPPSR